MVRHGTLSAPNKLVRGRLAGICRAFLGCNFLLVFVGPAVAMFDLREVQRAVLLAGLGTAIVIALFALLIEAHPPADVATGRAIKIAQTGSLHTAKVPDRQLRDGATH